MQGFASSIDIDFQIDLFKNFVTYKLLFRDLLWLYLWLFVVSSLAPFFEVIIFLLFEPFGVDFELSS